MQFYMEANRKANHNIPTLLPGKPWQGMHRYHKNAFINQPFYSVNRENQTSERPPFILGEWLNSLGCSFTRQRCTININSCKIKRNFWDQVFKVYLVIKIHFQNQSWVQVLNIRNGKPHGLSDKQCKHLLQKMTKDSQ